MTRVDFIKQLQSRLVPQAPKPIVLMFKNMDRCPQQVAQTH